MTASLPVAFEQFTDNTSSAVYEPVLTYNSPAFDSVSAMASHNNQQ
jgi:hypothetical protein